MIIAKALGFRSDGCGRWDFLGNVEQTPTGKKIMELATIAVDRFLQDVLPSTNEKLGKAAVKEFQRIARETYRSKLLELCRVRAAAVGENQAELDAEAIITKLLAQECPEIKIDNYDGKLTL